MFAVDLQGLPADFPTHRQDAVFWERLGRTVATFGFLEEVLGKAIFSFTAATRYAEAESDEAFRTWLQRPEGLERVLTDPLSGLIKQLDQSVKKHPDANGDGFEELLADLRKASRIRNALCHGSWRASDETGASEASVCGSKSRAVRLGG